MISRPRLRPTISRRIKYLSVAPRAERKLQRESRRGEHDLRRLVGHANFLDDLVDSLQPKNEDDESDINAHPSNPLQAGRETDAADEPSDDSSTASDDDDENEDDDYWSDSSDDEDHALVRTESGISIVNVDTARAAQQQTREAIAGSDAVDYFSQKTKSSAGLVVSDCVVTNLKDANKISVYEVVSPSSDALETLVIDDTKVEGS